MRWRQRGIVLFIGGILVGLAVAALVSAGVFWRLSGRGLVANLETEELARYVGKQVEIQVARELERVMAEVKAQIPQLVKQQMQVGYLRAEIKISDVNITLPPSALAELDQYLQGTVQATVYRLLEGIDLAALACDVGTQASEMIRSLLNRELRENSVLKIKTWWGTIPVIFDVGEARGQLKNPG